MPKNTGIKNRLDYLNRVIAEDTKTAGKDKAYGEYLNALTNLVKHTNDVYDNDGVFTKESYGDLVKAYLDVTEKANAYKVSILGSENITRMNVVNHIQKIISRDMKALNDMDKDNPGKIDDAFEASRAVKVNVPEGFASKVGGQMSDRFTMVSPDGKKGFFTVRTDTAKDERWKDLIDNQIKPLDLPKGIMEKLNQLKTDHKLRSDLQDVLFQSGVDLDERCANIAKQLGFFSSGTDAERAFKTDDYKPLRKAMEILATDAKKLVGPYNMVDRLKYDPYTRNDNKNAAMYEVAKFLGCEKLIAKAVPMVAVNGKEVIKGTFMEHAEGSDLADLKADDPLWDYDYKTGAYNPELYNDLADLQLIDYICGNIDRHKCNMFYKTSKDQDGKVKIVEFAIPAENKKPSYIPEEDDADDIVQPVADVQEDDEEDDDLALFMSLFADDDIDYDVVKDDSEESKESEKGEESEEGYSIDYTAEESSDTTGDEDDMFADDFAIENFQFTFDDDEDDDEDGDGASYVEADEFGEFDLDSLEDLLNDDLMVPRSEYQAPMVFDLTLEELMEMTDEY